MVTEVNTTQCGCDRARLRNFKRSGGIINTYLSIDSITRKNTLREFLTFDLKISPNFYGMGVTMGVSTVLLRI